ncbi:MAG: heparin lyase I family protein [Dehalococcoidia bacterium]
MSLLRRALRARTGPNARPAEPRPHPARTLSRWSLVVLAGIAMVAAASLAPRGGHVEASSRFNSLISWITTDAGELRLEHQRVSYEDGEEVPYSQAPSDDRLGYTSDIVRAGSRAGTVLLLPDDPAYRGNLGYRAEWQSDVYAEEGREYAYGVSYYLPDDWNQGRNPKTFDDRIIFQFHEGNGKSPTFSLHVDADRERLFVRHRQRDGDFDALWSTELETGEWYDFAFRVYWSRGNDGFLQIYLDGRLRYQYDGRTLNDSNRVYTKWGIYGQPTRLVVDEVSIVEGADGLFDATPARVATLMDVIPRTGVALVRFSGGDNDDLVRSSGCSDSAMFWFTLGGDLVWFNPKAPEFVNARWNALFGGDLPENTLLIATCSGG